MKTYALIAHNQIGYTTIVRHTNKSLSQKLTFHPAVSSVGVYDYKLTKLLTSTLDSVIPKNHCANFLLQGDKKVSLPKNL